MWKELESELPEIPSSITPPKDKIFRCMELCRAEDVKLIIVGQDPYPAKGAADGLAFSSHKMQKSLKAIFKCLKIVGKRPTDLEWLAKQGVLLLNTMLTRDPEIKGPKGEHSIWLPFTRKIVQNVIAKRGDKPLAAILLGNYAKNFMKDFEIKKFEWYHPAARGISFSDCKCFIEANRWLKNAGAEPIIYDYSIDIYTDGGCTGNGKKNAIATYGIYIPENASLGCSDIHISGKVPPSELKFGACISKTKKHVSPTNNRGEFMAFIMAVYYCFEKIGANENFMLNFYTDSKLLKNTLETWIWNWEKKKIINDKKNPDLLKIILKLYKKYDLRLVKITHVKAHTNSTDIHSVGNNEADLLCNNAFKYDSYGVNSTGIYNSDI